MNTTDKIYVAGHRGMVGSAIVRKLKAEGFENIVTRTSSELNLVRQSDVGFWRLRWQLRLVGNDDN